MNDFLLLVGLQIAQTSQGPGKASHAVHAILAQAMGQRQKLESRAEALGDRQENWKCKNFLNYFCNEFRALKNFNF